MTEPVHRGYVSRAEVGEDGEIRARLVPWWGSDIIGPTGTQAPGIQDIPETGDVRIRRRDSQPVYFNRTPAPKRQPRERVMSLALRLCAEVEGLRQSLGRPVVASDLSPQFLAAMKGEMWKDGEPVTDEQLWRVAEAYLEEAEREARSA